MIQPSSANWPNDRSEVFERPGRICASVAVLDKLAKGNVPVLVDSSMEPFGSETLMEELFRTFVKCDTSFGAT